MTTKPSQAANDIYVKKGVIQKLLEQLNSQKAAGPDGIKATLLKELAKEIAPILKIIFNISYDTGTIPEQWKTAIVQPVYIKGSKYDAANYRPISLTCTCCKLMEHIIAQSINQSINQSIKQIIAYIDNQVQQSVARERFFNRVVKRGV